MTHGTWRSMIDWGTSFRRRGVALMDSQSRSSRRRFLSTSLALPMAGFAPGIDR